MRIASANLYTVEVFESASSGWGTSDRLVGSFFVVAIDGSQAKAMGEAWGAEKGLTVSRIVARKRPSARTVYFPL